MSEEDMVLIVMHERGNTASAMDSTPYITCMKGTWHHIWAWYVPVSSHRDDWMGQILKTKKMPRASNDTPKKSLDQKLTPKISPAEFPNLKVFQKA